MKQLFLSLATMLCALCAQAQERAFLPLSGIWESSLGTCRLPGTTDENKLGNPAQAPTNATSPCPKALPERSSA